MKSEQESVVYNQGQRFHCAVRKFVAKLEVTFQNLVTKFDLKSQCSIQSSALHHSLTVRN